MYQPLGHRRGEEGKMENWICRGKFLQFKIKVNKKCRASLVVQWLRICLPMQGTWVQFLVWEDPTCCGAMKPMCQSHWPLLLSLWAATITPACPGAHTLSLEKLSQQEARELQWRVAPAHHSQRTPTAMKTQHSQKQIKVNQPLKRETLKKHNK